MKQKKEKNITIRHNFRLSEIVSMSLIEAEKVTPFNKTELVELALIELLPKVVQDLKFEDIDLKDHLKILKLEKMRRILGRERNEFLSKNLMMNRIHIDIIKIIRFNIEDSETQLKAKIDDYLQLRKKESTKYKNNDELIDQIKKLEQLTQTADLNITKIQDTIINRAMKINLLENGTKDY